MKVFVTGASGHIGSLVAAELLSSGHEVMGLARSEDSTQALVQLGVSVVHGTVEDLDVLSKAAKESDGVIHLAFRHDLMQVGKWEMAAGIDLAAAKAMGEALMQSNKPFVGVSGTLSLAFAGLDRDGTEEDVLPSGPRIDTENYIIDLAKQGVRSSVVRLAPTVHGVKDNGAGFIPKFIRIARESGFSAYVGNGQNRWPAVHELDAAHLFNLAFDHAPDGMRLHGVGDTGVAFKEIAETIGRQLDVPVKSISNEEALAHFEHLGRFASVDNPVSNEITRSSMHWQPTNPGLIADMDEGHYFKS
jgi:nucleoside-diphosphate-sugar epimerase